MFVKQSAVENDTVSVTYYNATFCQNVLSEDDPRYEGLVNFNCPDVVDLENFIMQVEGSILWSDFPLALQGLVWRFTFESRGKGCF